MRDVTSDQRTAEPLTPNRKPRRRRLSAARRAALLTPALLLAIAPLRHARADLVTWTGPSGTWSDNTGTSNWTPADEPDSVDTVFFEDAVTVTMGSNNTIASLNMFNGADLVTNGFSLGINGDTTFNGGVTGMTLSAGSTVTAMDIVLGTSSGSQLRLQGGTLTLSEIGSDTAVLTNLHGTVTGFGVMNFNDAPASNTTVFDNSSTLIANGSTGLIIGAPPAHTLQINAPNATARINLDGFSETGVVNVNRNQTLDINGTLSDAFTGDMTLYHNSTIDVSTAWSIDTGGTLTANNGATGVIPFATPADVSYVKGAGLTLAGGTITVSDADGTLQFDAPFTLTSGTIVNNGLIVFNANSSIGSASSFTMPTSSSSLTVNAGVSVTINTPNFNADGTESVTNVITINSGATLNLNLGAGGDISLDNTLNLNGGTLNFHNSVGAWAIYEHVNVGANTGTSTLTGDDLQFNSPIVSIGTGANLNITTPVDFKGGSYTGAGTLSVDSSSTTSVNTTIAVNTFNFDGSTAGQTHTINAGVALTINSPDFGSADPMNDNITVGGNNGSLIVNSGASWQMQATLTTNPTNVGHSVIGGTSRMILTSASADFNVNGTTWIDAPVTFGTSSVTTVASAATLIPNAGATYDGATISGAGRFNAAPTNTVVSNTLINVSKFDFSAGAWTVNAGVTLTVNVADYNPNLSFKEFDNTITLNSGSLSVTSLDGSFTVNDTFNMNNTTGVVPNYSGHPLVIGNDLGLSANATLAVGGTGTSTITPIVTFESDAHLTVAAGATLVFLNTANFESATNATTPIFSGPGTLIFESSANVDHPTTLNFTGGTVDLDGRNTDIFGDVISVNAPLTINAATLDSFGKSNIGGTTNMITVDHLNAAKTGSLAVNLDSPASSWTLNSQGVINLINTTSPLTLLSGSPLNVLGSIGVTGDVRTTARLDIGSTGNVTIYSVNEPLRLAGGSLANPNTIAGGTINGPGLLGADPGFALVGFGTINAPIDFDGTAELRAKNGTLTLNGNLLDVGIVGTADATGTLAVTNPQILDFSMTMELLGGSVTGAALTNNGYIRGSGTVANNVTNASNGIIRPAPASTLKFTGVNGTSAGWVMLNNGTAEFNNPLTVAAATGFIFGPGTLKANSGLTNNGTLQPFGVTTVFGNVTSTSGSYVLIESGATATFDGNVTLNAGASLGAGAGSTNYFLSTLSISGTAQLFSNVAATSIHVLTINPGGTFDTANNKLIIDYTGSTPADTIRSYILTGRLFSSTASADAQNRMTIGYAEASQLGISSWSGLPVDSTALLTKLTWFGDANLDGKVNADDFALIDRGFVKGLTGWSNGDFNHSGSVTTSDYLLIDRVYAQQSGTLSPEFLAMRESQFGADYVSQLLVSIPEPSSLLAACVLALPLLTRRRSHR